MLLGAIKEDLYCESNHAILWRGLLVDIVQDSCVPLNRFRLVSASVAPAFLAVVVVSLSGRSTGPSWRLPSWIVIDDARLAVSESAFSA